LHTVLGYLIADLGVRCLPPRWADRLGVWLARGVFALRPPARRAAEQNLQRLEPRLRADRRRRLARQTFEHFALTLVEFLRRGHGRPAAEDAVVVRGRRHLERARAASRGVILLSAHVGNWERGAAFVAGSGIALRVVARPHPHHWVDGLFRRRRLDAGVETLEGRPLWATAALALRRGEWVALLGDRGPSGNSTSVCSWAAALARRTGALVLPAVMVRIAPRRYAACFGPPLSAAACARGGYRSVMRRFLRRYSSQWCAFEPLPSGWA
jgi:KDO2-lipid IV(A) lauroyltransferase